MSDTSPNRPQLGMSLAAARMGLPWYEGTVSQPEKESRRALNRRARIARRKSRR